MKALSCLAGCLGIVLLTTFQVSAQLMPPTTEAEYNYGTVGYKLQLQAKLDTKAGYSLRDAEGCEEEDRKLEYKLLYRDGEEFPCAVFVAYSRPRVAPVYYCIPSANASPELWKKFHDSLTTGTDNPAAQLQFFSSCFARLMMGFAIQKP